MAPATPTKGGPKTPENSQSQTMTPRSMGQHTVPPVLGSPLEKSSPEPDAPAGSRPPVANVASDAGAESIRTPAPSSPQEDTKSSVQDGYFDQARARTPESSPARRDRSHVPGLGPRSPIRDQNPSSPGRRKRTTPPDLEEDQLSSNLGSQTGSEASHVPSSPPSLAHPSQHLPLAGQPAQQLGPAVSTSAEAREPLHASFTLSNALHRGGLGGAAAGHHSTPPDTTTSPVSYASDYARSPTSPARSSHTAPRSAGTPGRAYNPSPHSRAWSGLKTPGSTSSSSSRRPISASSVPPMPLRTFFLTKEEADSLPENNVRPALNKALDAVEMYERAAYQFRSLANQLHVQGNLAAIARSEDVQRQEVETNITQREVERLITEVMGYTDASIGAEAIRQKLRRTRQRLKDMETLVDERGREIAVLRQQLRDMRIQPKHIPPMAGGMGPHPGPSQSMSGLELLASQVLSEQLNQSPDKRPRRPSSSSTISARSDDTEDDEEA